MSILGKLAILGIGLACSLPWLFFVVMPLFALVWGVLAPAFKSGARLIRNSLGRVRLKHLLTHTLRLERKKYGEACACIHKEKSGKLHLVVQFRGRFHGMLAKTSHHVAADNLAEAVRRMEPKLHRSAPGAERPGLTRCTSSACAYPCANEAHCPKRAHENFAVKRPHQEIMKIVLPA
jgi:hypothetical protein